MYRWCKPAVETRLRLARVLTCNEVPQAAQEIIDRVLEDCPGDHQALALRADIYASQEKYVAAERLAELVLSEDDRCIEAWMTLVAVHQERGCWEQARLAATRGLQAGPPDGWKRHSLLEDRAKASLELDELEELEKDIETLSAAGVEPAATARRRQG